MTTLNSIAALAIAIGAKFAKLKVNAVSAATAAADAKVRPAIMCLFDPFGIANARTAQSIPMPPRLACRK